MILYALVLCLCGVQFSSSLSTNEDSVVEDSSLEYKHLGCFRLTKEQKAVYLGVLDEVSTGIEQCAGRAKAKGYTTFSIEWGGQCYSGPTATQNYDKNEPQTGCNGLGGFMLADVYQFEAPSAPSATQPPTPAPEYEHIGCFKDTKDRALPELLGEFRGQSDAIQKCAKLAKDKGYSMFGVQYGGQCFSGPSASETYDKYGPQTNCANGVGGFYSNDIYRFPVAEYRHIGCFKDTKDRALPELLGEFRGQSDAIQKCAKLAKDKGYSMFGVQYGGQCFSGPSASKTYDKYGPETNCANGVGGFYSNDIYSFGALKPTQPPPPPPAPTTPRPTQPPAPQHGYKALGCFKDTFEDRALPDYIGNFDPEELIEKCYEAAKAKGYKVFGAQHKVECWSGSNGENTYNKHGKATSCVDGIGRQLSNFVYEIY